MDQNYDRREKASRLIRHCNKRDNSYLMLRGRNLCNAFSCETAAEMPACVLSKDFILKLAVPNCDRYGT